MCLCDLDEAFCLGRFTVRDFQYNEEEMKADKEEMTRLSTDKKKQFVSEVDAQTRLDLHIDQLFSDLG